MLNIDNLLGDTLANENERIRFESDNKRDAVPYDRSYIEMVQEAEYLVEKLNTLESKKTEMSGIVEHVLAKQTTCSAVPRTESDFNATNLSVYSDMEEVATMISNCSKGTELEIGGTVQAFVPTMVSARYESFDGMDFDSKVKMRSEGIGDFFSKVWEYIKKFFKWIWEGIKKMFSSICNLFRSNKKILSNLKLEIEKMNLEKGERTEYDPSKSLIFFTEVVKDNDRTRYLENLNEAIEQAKSGVEGYYLPVVKCSVFMVQSIESADQMSSEDYKNYIGMDNDNGATAINAIKTLKARLDKKDAKLTTDVNYIPTTRVFKYCNQAALTLSKFKDPGYYFCIGFDGDEAKFLHTQDSVQGEVRSCPIVAGKAPTFKAMSADTVKSELVELCELGISICEEYESKKPSELEADFKTRESDMLGLFEDVKNVVIEGFNNAIPDEAKQKEFEKEVGAVLQVVTRSINKSTSALIAAVAVVAKQPVYIIKTVKEGLRTIE